MFLCFLLARSPVCPPESVNTRDSGYHQKRKKNNAAKITRKEGFSRENKRNCIWYLEITFARDGRDALRFYPMYFGPINCATRSEASKAHFWHPQNHGIRIDSTIYDFCDFRKTQGREANGSQRVAQK